MATEGVFPAANHANVRALDVVFIHGLGGHHINTWLHRSRDGRTFSWPASLGDEHPDWAVWTVQYSAPISAFAAAPSMTIQDRASNLALQLRNVGIGDRPSVFIMHSLGGLVVKAMCVQGVLGNADNRIVADSMIGLVFCGTPHRGSAIASAAKALGGLRGRQISELALNTDTLNRAHREFLAWQAQQDIAVQTYYETVGIAYKYRFLPIGRKGLVVTQTSADTGVARAAMYPIGADHHAMVKPHSRDDAIYASVSRFLSGLAPAAMKKHRSVLGQPPSEYRHNLPDRVPFIAREDQLKRIQHALTQRERVIAVLGMGGMGKSALAIEALHRLSEKSGSLAPGHDYRAVIWASAKDRDLRLPDVLSIVASVLDLPGLGALGVNDQEITILELLYDYPCILAIDNADTLSDPAVLAFALRVSGRSCVLLTSREDVVPDDAVAVRLERLSDEDALLLLESELARRDSSLVAVANQDGLRELCVACGGAPLAIKWVAAQVATRAQSIESVLEELATASGDVFYTTFSRSWSSLDNDSKSALMAMPCFAAGATLPPLSAAANLSESAASQAVARLASLSLIDVSPQARKGHRKYSLHPLTAAFAKSQDTPESVKLARGRLADWMAGLAKTAGQGDVTSDLVESELPNFMESARWCHREEAWPTLLKISLGLREVLPDSGHWNEAVELGALGIQAATALDDTYHVGRLAVIPMGWVSRYRGQFPKAESWYRRAVEAFTIVEDHDRAAWARLAIGNILLRQGRESEGRQMAEAVRDSGVGNTPARVKVVRAAALVHLSEMAAQRGDPTTSHALADEARRLSMETGYVNSTMSATYWMGVAKLRSGHPQEAEALLRESLRLNTNARVLMGIALCNTALAECLLLLDRRSEAKDCATSGKNLLQRLGMRQELAEFLVRVEPQLD